MLNTSSSPLTLMTPVEKTFYARLGRRIAERRKEQGITQVQLAQTLGIAQQTMAHYEGGKVRIAAAMLPVVAEALDLGIDGLIDVEAKKPKKATAHKRGPVPKIQRQLERVNALPKARQRVVIQVLDSMLAQGNH